MIIVACVISFLIGVSITDIYFGRTYRKFYNDLIRLQDELNDMILKVNRENKCAEEIEKTSKITATNTGNKLSDFKAGDAVQYIPNHAFGNSLHPDCEFGIVKSIGMSAVWVNFYKGKDLSYTAQGCDPTNLRRRV